MKKQIFVTNVVEKSTLEEELKNSNIEFSFIATDDNVLGLNISSPESFGYFLVDETNYDLGCEILNNIRSDIEHPEIVQSKERFWLHKPWVITLFMIVLGILVASISFLGTNNKEQRTTERTKALSNYRTEVNKERTITTRYYSDTGLIEGIFYDRNRNGEFEEEDIFDRSGLLLYKAISTGDNGFFDYEEGYSKTGKVIWKEYEKSSTRRTNNIDYFLPNGNIMTIEYSLDDGDYKDISIKSGENSLDRKELFQRK